VEHTALELIDKLMACWNNWDSNEAYYLTVLAPSIARSDGSEHLMNNEQKIVAALRHLLSEAEWQQLPTLIAQRRANNLNDLASDRERAEAQRESKRREDEERIRRKEAEAAQIAHKRALVARLKALFGSDYLSADGVLTNDPDAELITGEEYSKLQREFVQDWTSRNLGQPLDSEQASAVAASGGDILVVARAGSGKTRTLVTRAIFLQKHCRVSPRALLLLAFNKKAAEEMKGRLAQTLGENLPHVMTFHALAYALVPQEGTLMFDDPSTDQWGLSREVQEVIDEHMRSKEHANRIRTLMLAHFREDWERIADGRFQLTMDEFLAYRRALPRESLQGDYVKSFGEKIIANALFEHGVEYRYERNFRWDGVNYRPDFTIPLRRKGGVIIEYFGMKSDADYDEMSQKKREFWATRKEWTFLEFSPENLAKNGVDAFIDILLRKLEKAGVSCQRRSEEEIWELVRRRALDGFTAAMKAFVGRCRRRNLGPHDIEAMVAAHRACSTAEGLFLEIGVSIYTSYLQRLTTKNEEDFDGLMWRSASLIRQGQTQFARDKGKEQGDLAHLKFVMIDEFQDFSAMFFELVDAVRSVNPGVQFFCVGDDWQAINGFAGSELRFFTDFARYFRHTSQHCILRNYRSPKSVIAVGNALMDGRGPVAEPDRSDAGHVWLCKLDEFTPAVAEQAQHNGDEITPAVLRLVRSFLDRGLDVVLLSRRNGLPWYVHYDNNVGGASNTLTHFGEHIQFYLPEEDRERIHVSTTHRYKGLEQRAVIVLDAVQKSYPLIHPHWVFLRVFGDNIKSIEDEERRLFYVAITRAMDSLALVTETLRESPFLADIRRHAAFDPLLWEDLPSVPSLDGARLEIRVFNAYGVKDQLIDLKYHWDSAGKYWHKAVLEEAFSFEALLAQPWVRHGIKVEVYDETGNLRNRR
jgi:DNA helicase-4